ncbi:MAG: VWA domain-containing protein, partial [Armatimonadetes bacterium]|nr:VWA domain-containing protein [Armatimonadota bacterium]
IALAARTGGVPLRLLRRQRRILKPRLLVLCDVSGSVRRTAGFLLRLLHTTQRLFDQTAAFVFVDRPVSAAPLLRAGDATRGLAELETLAGLDLYALSDFGNLFVELLDDHATLLTSRTSLLVLGDARCNRFDPQVWALEGIARRVAHLVWLNPERRERWYTADSRLRDYQPWIDHLLPAETPADLAAGVEALLRAPRPFERRTIG